MNLSTNVVWHHATVTRARREAQNGHRGAIIRFTGLSGAGKSTLVHEYMAEAELFLESLQAADEYGSDNQGAKQDN